MDNSLSVYQHPTLTVLLDDSQSFLDSLAFHLNPHLPHKVFHDAQTALDWLHSTYLDSKKNKMEPLHVGYNEQTGSLERLNVSVYLDQIYSIATNRQRFDMPAVLVVDYMMPQMNGVEFCQKIQGLPCKRIMLTGNADENIAVDAFNRNLIDSFIKKNDPDLLGQLETEIFKLQKEYFNAQTRTLKDLLSRHTYAFLSDPAMESLIEQLCKRFRFVEFYLFPHPDGILFFDIKGRATLMVIETKASLIAHFEIALDQGAPPELLTALREFRLVPFFSDTGGIYQDVIAQDWLSYCLSPQICRGRQEYYWAMFEFPLHYLHSPVYSYAEYLLDQEAGY